MSLLSGYRLSYAIGIGAVLFGVGVAIVLLRQRKPAAEALTAAEALRVSEVAVDTGGGDTPRIVRGRPQDQDLGGDVAEQPGEVILA